MAIVIEIPYKPRGVQNALHNDEHRFQVIVAHRRFGKTVFAINHLLRAALTDSRRAPRYAYIAPLYKQAKQIAWDMLKHYAGACDGVRFNEAELRADFPSGARITLYGADNPDSLRGIYLMGVVLDEYGDMKSRTWTEIIRPALADHQGWATFIGTPKGRNQFYKLFELGQGQDPEWRSHIFKASDTGYVDAKELESAKRSMSENRFAQEFECSFDAAIEGAVYAGEFQQIDKDKRICGVPVEPAVEVNTAWDLGFSDSTTITFYQVVGREVRIVDYYEASGVGIDHYARIIKDKNYLYGTHHMPHDVDHHELSTGMTRKAAFERAGISPIMTVKRPKLKADGIEAVRRMLPRCWFDAVRCKDLTEALRLYRYEVDERLSTEEQRHFRPNPLHDWTSHAADSVQTLALALDTLPTSDWGKPLKYDVAWVV